MKDSLDNWSVTGCAICMYPVKLAWIQVVGQTVTDQESSGKIRRFQKAQQKLSTVLYELYEDKL